jgi:hypothetical protein
MTAGAVTLSAWKKEKHWQQNEQDVF